MGGKEVHGDIPTQGKKKPRKQRACTLSLNQSTLTYWFERLLATKGIHSKCMNLKSDQPKNVGVLIRGTQIGHREMT